MSPDPYEQGYSAFHVGAHNPYPRKMDCYEHWRWEDGNEAARQDFANGKGIYQDAP